MFTRYTMRNKTHRFFGKKYKSTSIQKQSQKCKSFTHNENPSVRVAVNSVVDVPILTQTEKVDTECRLLSGPLQFLGLVFDMLFQPFC